jgi:thiol-disulfide isomerase/thioredoxin
MTRADKTFAIAFTTSIAILILGTVANWPKKPVESRPVALAPVVAPVITTTPTTPTTPKPVTPTTPKLQMIVFTATWCTVCQEQKPIVAQIEKRGVKVWRIDYDQRPDLVAKYNVTAVPTYVFYNGEKPFVTNDANAILKEITNE